MILHLLVYGLIIRLVVGSEEDDICNTNNVYVHQVVEKTNKCMDRLFEDCTKAADDVKEMYTNTITMKDDKCSTHTTYLSQDEDNVVFLMVLERYDYNADYYHHLREYPSIYVDDHSDFPNMSEDKYNELRVMFCPNYTKKSCRAILNYCDDKEYSGQPFCVHPSYGLYKDYLQCYHTPSKATNCAVLCDKVVTKKLFGIEKTDDVNCKSGRERCENIETAALIHECEGHFKATCDVSDPNTYSQCEEHIRRMKATPQALVAALEDHKCKDTNSRLICFQYLKLLGEGKMSAHFVESHCSKNSKPEICNAMEEYCRNSNLKLLNNTPECKKQTEAITTSTLAPLNQSYQSTAAFTIVTTSNREVEQKISFVLLISLPLFV